MNINKIKKISEKTRLINKLLVTYNYAINVYIKDKGSERERERGKRDFNWRTSIHG